MKRLCLIMSLVAFGLAGGCVESTFCLSRGSNLPQGLQKDDEAQRVGRTASRIELWLYTYDPPKLKFFTGPDMVLSREGGEYGNTDDGFTVQFNGIETKFRRVAYPNVIAVEEDSGTASHGGS